MFADLYLDALDADRRDRQRVPRPWRLAFDAPADLPPLRHVLLGINAHINYDLPQALLAVISDADFADPVLMARRRRDHERIDAVLSPTGGRGGRRTGRARPAADAVDRLLQPLNQAALQALPARGPAEGVAQHRGAPAGPPGGPRRTPPGCASWRCSAPPGSPTCCAPGQVLLRLASPGFGVTLPRA